MLMQDFGVTNKEYYGMLWHFFVLVNCIADQVQKFIECSFRGSAGPVRFRDLEQSRINLRDNTDMLSK